MLRGHVDIITQKRFQNLQSGSRQGGREVQPGGIREHFLVNAGGCAYRL